MLALPCATNDSEPRTDDVSPYLLRELRILRDVCRSTGRDDGGRLCPQCCVRDFCEKQARCAGRLSALEEGLAPGWRGGREKGAGLVRRSEAAVAVLELLA